MTVSDVVRLLRIAASAGALAAAVWTAGSGAAIAVDDRILVVIDRKAAGNGATMPAHYLPRPAYDGFLSNSLAEFRTHRDLVVSNSRDILQGEARQAVAGMRERLPAFADWRYSFFSSYRLTFSALASAVTGGNANEAVQATVQERFQAMVVDPYVLRARLETAAIRAQEATVGWRHVFEASQREALDTLVSQRGAPWDGQTANAVVTESTLLFPPAPGSTDGMATAVPAVTETPTVGLGAEAAVLAARQATRRGVGIAAEPLVIVPAAELVVGAIGVVATPVVGAAAFAVGLVAEYAIARTWDSVDRETFLADASKSLDDIEAALLQEAERRAEALTDTAFGSVPQWNAALP